MTILHKTREVQIQTIRKEGESMMFPECDTVCPGYDQRRRQWRHLDVGEGFN